MNVCMCVCKRECAYVRDRERERVCGCERECVYVRDRERESVCVCVCEKKREREFV